MYIIKYLPRRQKGWPFFSKKQETKVQFLDKMKFYTNQLPNLIKKIADQSIKSLLLYGHNRGFISNIIEELVKEFNFLTVNLNAREITEENLYILGNSYNFFNQKELIKVDYSGSVISERLKEFLTAGDFANFICFVGDTSLLASSNMRKLFENSLKMAAIGCHYEDESMTIEILNSMLKKYCKSISREALSHIKEFLRGDYQIIKNELSKLMYYTHDKHYITYQDVEASLSLHFTNEEKMCNSFIKKDLKLFLDQVEKLLILNLSELSVVRSLRKYYVNLFIACSKIENGENTSSAVKAIVPPLFFKHINTFIKNAQNLSSTEAVRVIGILQKAEIKARKNTYNLNFIEDIYLPIHG